jgi:hypothetical protein
MDLAIRLSLVRLPTSKGIAAATFLLAGQAGQAASMVVLARARNGQSSFRSGCR